MKKKNKFYYSELEDQIIINSILEDFKNRREERKPYELMWELNFNYYLGNQYSFISGIGEVHDYEKNYYWENREVFNHIAPIIESRLSKLNKIKPRLTVKSSTNSESDLYSAKLARAVLNKVSEKNSLDSLVLMATSWSEITGTSFYKVSWNSDQGDIIGKTDEKIIKNGDVNISICSPFEIYPDSNAYTDINECSSIIHARPIPVKEANETWNLNLTGDDIDTCELGNNSFISGLSSRGNSTKIIHSIKHDQVLLIEKYEKPTINTPNGHLSIICKDKLVYDGDLPYLPTEKYMYPIIKQVSIKQVSNFWGRSIIERCIPIQKSYNLIKNKKHEYITRLASGVLAVEDGSVDIDNLEEEGLAPGKILVYRNGSTPPKFLDPGSVPNEFEKEEERLLNEFNRLSSVSNISSNSDIPGNLNSATALSLLIEQDNSRLSTTGEYIREAIKKVGQLTLSLYKKFATEVRLSKIIDSTGSLELHYWNNNDLLIEDIILESCNELEQNTDDKKDMILSLLNKGILEDKNNKLQLQTKKTILKIFNLEEIEPIKDIDEIHYEKASKENIDAKRLTVPLEIDNHKIHIDEHTRYILENTNLTEDETQKLISHIKIHQQFL